MQKLGERREPTESWLGPDTTGVPGGIPLCQVDQGPSCGACCGLYNIPNLSIQRLSQLLHKRSRRLKSLPRSIEALDGFAEAEQQELGPDRPYPEFHHCPFVGFIDDSQGRVGCLLHPCLPENRGIDYRGLSYYGGAACRLYFCPSHTKLEPVFKRILQRSEPGWYLYGLMLTEHRLLRAFFKEIEARLGRSLRESDIDPANGSREHLLRFLTLKEGWPYRHSSSCGPCHHVFESRPPGGIEPESRLEVMLRELETDERSPSVRLQAKADLEVVLEHLVRAMQAD